MAVPLKSYSTNLAHRSRELCVMQSCRAADILLMYGMSSLSDFSVEMCTFASVMGCVICVFACVHVCVFVFCVFV